MVNLLRIAFVTLLIIGSSLHSIFDYKIFLLCLLSLLPLLGLYKRVCFSKIGSELFTAITVLFILTAYYLYPKFQGVQTEENIDFYYMRTVLGLALFFLFFSTKNINELSGVLIRAITITLAIHVFVFVVSMYFSYSGIDFNLIALYSSNLEQRANPLYYGSNIYRPTGFFNEPGTYAVVISILLACRILLLNRLDAFGLLIIASILLTFSIQGFFLAAALLFAVLPELRFSLRGVFFGVIIFVVVSGFVINYVFEYVVLRLSSPLDDVSTFARLMVFDEYFNIDVVDKIIGVGLGENRLGILIADAGFLFSTIYFMGVVGIFLIIVYFKIAKMKPYILPFMLILLFTKVELRYIVLWVLFGSIYISSSINRKLKNSGQPVPMR